MNKRRKNEKEYSTWTELENGGRIYVKKVNAGDKSGNFAQYEKKVDQNEKTITFVQKIIDKSGNVLEIHEKFPIDKGHIVLSFLLLLLLGITTYSLF